MSIVTRTGKCLDCGASIPDCSIRCEPCYRASLKKEIDHCEFCDQEFMIRYIKWLDENLNVKYAHEECYYRNLTQVHPEAIPLVEEPFKWDLHMTFWKDADAEIPEITDPPCKHCKSFKPSRKYDENGSCIEIRICHNSYMNNDFSCFEVRE